jgi:hypothetical protein
VPTEPLPPSLAEVVNRAVDVVDPEGANDGVAELQRRLEDRDEPVTAILAEVEEILAEAKGAVDPQDEDPEVVMATAVATYLAHRRDELDDDPDEILRLAARAEFDGHPPPNVGEWLSARGLDQP